MLRKCTMIAAFAIASLGLNHCATDDSETKKSEVAEPVATPDAPANQVAPAEPVPAPEPEKKPAKTKKGTKHMPKKKAKAAAK